VNDSYLYAIAALLPLTSCMLVLQTNPYHALVIRGMVGAVAALVYAVLGAADVALTEALVGTMLAIMLYAVAVRSSMVMRLGVLADKIEPTPTEDDWGEWLKTLRAIASKRHLRLELVPYPDSHTLHQALLTKEVHVTCIKQAASDPEKPPYHTATRVRHLYDILQSELALPATLLTYIAASESGEKK
jgi:putative multicomponent Na+:H+ antiporter subunit B